MTDRRAFLVGLAVITAWTGCPSRVAAQSTPGDFQVVLKSLIGDATPIEGKILLELPEIAENGNTVPYTVRVESPMTDTQYVKAVHLLAPGNPLPQISSFFFTPQSGKAADAAVKE